MDSVIASLFLSHSTAKLHQMAAAVDTSLAKLSDEQIWVRASAQTNSIANLLLHLEGNLRQYIVHTLGGAPDVRDRPAEFSAAGGLSREEVQKRFHAAVEDAASTIAALTPARLAERVMTRDGERSVLEIVYQVVGHLQQHTGQIIFAAKQFTGEDLGIYRPPDAAAAERR